MSNKVSPFVDIKPKSSDIDDMAEYRLGSGDDYLDGNSQYVTSISGGELPITDGSKPKRGRPKKTDSDQRIITVNGNINYDPNRNPDGSVNYHAPYNETDAMLKNAIGQTDAMLNDVVEDLRTIRASKSMTKKYSYITDLSSTSSSLIATKIQAVRELNNSIRNANELEFKMQKELKAMEVSKDDNKNIMDMYNAFMSVPVGTYKAPLAPSIQDMTLTNGTNLSTIDIMDSAINGSAGGIGDTGYQNYLANLTPEQNRMRHENDPNIQTVVVYDQSNGRKWFDVIDIRTGNSVPNMPKPDEFLLEDTRPDVVNMVARNTNINVTYPLRVVGEKSSLYDY